MKERIGKLQLNSIIATVIILCLIAGVCYHVWFHKEYNISQKIGTIPFSQMKEDSQDSIKISKASFDEIKKDKTESNKSNKQSSNQEDSPSFNEIASAEAGNYFVTSIIDGETVPEQKYYFTITHIRDELEVDKVQVAVNKKYVKDFAGSVFLKKGENRITVRCTYLDARGNKIIAQKDYTVNVGDKALIISTSLQDQVTDNPYFQFYATATFGQEKCDLEVSVNGEMVKGDKNGVYDVVLESGDNYFVLISKAHGNTEKKTFIITLDENCSWGIFTNLSSKTVNANYIDFNARPSGGSLRAYLQVFVNGNQIDGKGDKYHAGLEIGNNTIRIKAIDYGKESVSVSYTVRYVPLSTKKTAPKITYINISDGKKINGDTYKLSIDAEDYKGNIIYYDGIEVRLNGKKIQYRWSSPHISYQLNLKNGDNQVTILLRDNDGREKMYSYTIESTYIEEGTVIGTVKIVVDAKVLHLGKLCQGNVEIYYKDTVADALTRFLESKGFSYDATGTTKKGFYLAAIKKGGITNGWHIDDALIEEIENDGLMLNRDPDKGGFVYSRGSLGQYDFCQGSGWMYGVNGAYTNYGMSEYKLEEGDDIMVRYTLAYGKDINAFSSTGGNQGIKDKYDNTY